MGDQNHHVFFAARNSANSRRDLLFGDRIERRSRLVEDKQPRAAQQGAGNRQPLTLPTGYSKPALSQACVQTLPGALHQRRNGGPSQRIVHFFVGGIRLDEQQILADGTRKQLWVLRHKTDLPADRVVTKLVDGNAIDRLCR